MNFKNQLKKEIDKSDPMYSREKTHNEFHTSIGVVIKMSSYIPRPKVLNHNIIRNTKQVQL